MADQHEQAPPSDPLVAFSGGDGRQSGVFVNGTMASGPYAMKGRIWLSKDRLTRSVMGRLFCLDPSTILLKSGQTNDMVAADSTGAFPIEKLSPEIEWQCEGEPARKYGKFNSYVTVKTAGIGVLDFGLLVTHVGMLISLIVIQYPSAKVVTGLEPFTIAAVAGCIFLEILLALLIHLIGVVDIDEGDGPETAVAMCNCFGRLVYTKTLRYWNNAVLFAACFLSAASLVSTVAYVVIMIQNGSGVTNTSTA